MKKILLNKKKSSKHVAYNQRKIRIAGFKNEIDAAKSYDKKAKELFGEFARLNFN